MTMYATQQLRDEHDGIRVMLAVLEHLAGELQRGAAVDTGDLASILDFLRTFADKCHHGKEEELLFPALVAAGLPEHSGPIAVMLIEHTQGRAFIHGMGDVLAQLPDAAARASFAEHALGYVHLLRAHIEKENQVLFSMAEMRLSAADHTRLLDAFEQIETERIGVGKHEQYHALLHALRDRYLPKAA